MANGISLKLVNLEQVFNRLTIKPVIVNEIAEQLSSGRAAEQINEIIRTHYPDDKLNTLPTCECGELVGGGNEGEICPNPTCRTVCERIVDKPLQSQIWMRVPDGIPAFIAPRFWVLFTTYTTTKRFDLLEYLTDPQYIPGGRGSNTSSDPRVQAAMHVLKENHIKRGLDNFYFDFDRIMDVVLQPHNFNKFKGSKDPGRRRPPNEELRELITKYRDCIFTKHLPFPSRLVLVSEQAGPNTYIDPNMTPAFDAVKTLCSIENDPMMLSKRVIQSRTVKVIKLMADYYSNFKQNTCGRKKGIFRRQLGSTRSPYTGRAVIAPLAMAHAYDEIHTPWAWTVSLLRVHIANKLLRRDYTPKQLFRLIDQYTRTYGVVLHEVINELIADCPEGGIPIALLRNPTLERLSNQNFRITKVLTNVDVYAILISVLAIKGSNADKRLK